MYSYYKTSSDDLVINAEKCKEIILDKLVREKFLTEKQAETFTSTWHFVIFKPSLYKRYFEKLFKSKEERDIQKDSLHIVLSKFGE